MEKIRLLSLFSGIGAFEKGLEQAGVPFDLINYCEIDKHASKCYSIIHNVQENKNLWDVTKIDTQKLGQIDMITHGSPCQDFSSAGLQKGGEEGSGTRSSLLWETVRIVIDTKPKYIIWENVKNVVKGKHKQVFDKYLETLENIGYNNYVPDKYTLNAKDYGIPQNRERVFVVSIRKDVDNKTFVFPKPIELKTTVRSYADFREKDDITNSFFSRFKEKFGEDKTVCDFIKYINDLPIKSGIGTKKMNLYDFNEMDTITMLDNITGTLTCRNVQNYNKKFWYNNKLYRPSPKMCFELMGFSHDDYEKIKNTGRDSDLYNRAGNSIVVNVVYEIFKSLFYNNKDI